MSKFTPGPWSFEVDDCWVIRDAGGDSFMGNETFYPWNSDNEADWHLIAAAPEMYEALKLASEALEEGLETEGDLEAEHSKHARAFLKEVHKILAKARGEVEA